MPIQVDHEKRNAVILRMRDEEQKSVKKVAEELEISESLVRMIYNKAKHPSKKIEGVAAWLNKVPHYTRKVIMNAFPDFESSLSEDHIREMLTDGTIWQVKELSTKVVHFLCGFFSVAIPKNNFSDAALQNLEMESQKVISARCMEYLRFNSTNHTPSEDFKEGERVFCSNTIFVNGKAGPHQVTIKETKRLQSGKALYMIETGKNVVGWYSSNLFWTKEQILGQLAKLIC